MNTTQPTTCLKSLRAPLCAVCSAVAIAAAATPLPALRADEVDSDSQRLVYLGIDGPTFLRFEFNIRSTSLSGFRRAFAERQFRQLDADKSEALEPTEAAKVPSLGQAGAEPQLGDGWTKLDDSPKDGKLSVDELASFFETAMGSPFTLTRQIKERFQEVDLIERLDADNDRAVSEKEMQNGLQHLIRLDLDDDETISAAELAPLFDPTTQQIGVAEENTQEAYPFLLVPPDAEFTEIAKSVISHYDRPVAGLEKGDGQLSETEIPGVFARLKRFDRDRDSRLSVDELTYVLSRDSSSETVSVTMPSRGRPSIDLPELDGRPIEFRVFKRGSDTRDTVSFYKLNFFRADADKNRYLNEQEFGGAAIPNATFEMCDLDGDGMVVLNELSAFLDQRTTLSQARVIMRVETIRTSLFELLDTNLDRRLSRREFLSGTEKVSPHDLDRDQLLEQSEMETSHRVVIELARTDLFRQMTRPQMAANGNSPRLQQVETGPVWFQRMDVNRDGDVSRREFVGPRDHFDRLDTNKDDFIDAEEADVEAIPSQDSTAARSTVSERTP